jgi:hypothetical protein
MICSKNPENINIVMDDDAVSQLPKFKYFVSIFTEDGESKEEAIIRIKEAKVMFNNKNQLLCSNNLSWEIKKRLISSCIWSVAVYGSETWTLGQHEQKVVSAFGTLCWRRMVKIKWTDRVTNDEVFQRAKEERLLLKILDIDVT